MAERDEDSAPEDSAGSGEAEPDPAPADDSAPPTTGASDPGSRAPGGEDNEDRQTFTVINEFYGQVSANAIGVSGGASASGRVPITRQSGELLRGTVRHALRYYMEPAPFDPALEIFQRRHLIALTGPEGCGKWAGALQLASIACPGDGSFTVLPPTRLLTELVEMKEIKAGQAYLLHDWIPGSAGTASAARFDLEQMESRLQREGAYLAITFESADSIRVLLDDACVQWSAPEPVALLDRCIARIAGLRPSEDQHDQLKALAGKLRAPKQIIKVAEAAARDIPAALAAAQENEASVVTAWFDAQPTRWQVWSVTALTFLSGVGEHSFERLLSGLTRIAEADRIQDPDGEQPTVSDDDSFPQIRWRLANNAGLNAFISERALGAPVGTQHRPAFRTKEWRLHFMLELNRRFGDDLWSPLRRWLYQLADLPYGEAQIAAGYGLALLARCALHEVERVYLDIWSAGTLQNRLVAVSVLWSMAEDDEVAAAAMAIAVSWVRNRGPERAVTAALAFGGPLGQLHPLEAMRWLWVLALRGERVGRVARTAMSRLFEVEPESTEERSQILRFLRRKTRRALSGQVPVTARERRAVLSAVNSVLATTQGTADVPVLASILRARPADVATVGELWAGVLNSVPHRRDAIRSLHHSLIALIDDDTSEQLARRLGEAIRPRLNDRASETLAFSLPDPEWTEGVSAAVLAAFLGTRSRTLGAIP